MAVEAGVGAVLLLGGRLVYGGIMIYFGVMHLVPSAGYVDYARAKGVPLPAILVPLTGAMLVFGGAGIVLGAFKVLAAGTLVAFLLVVAPKMHDYWNAPDDQRQTEQLFFLKDVQLLAAALAFLAIGAEHWGYALNVGL